MRENRTGRGPGALFVAPGVVPEGEGQAARRRPAGEGLTLMRPDMRSAAPARPAGAEGLSLVLAIATTGRRAVLSALLPLLARQERLPDALFVCIAQEDDIDLNACRALPFPVVVTTGEKGLTRQRNRLLDEIAALAPSTDLLAFIDDDFLLSPGFLGEAVRLFEARPEIVLATGRVLADGITSRGIALEDGLRAIERDHASPGRGPEGEGLSDVFNAYGCNMVMRWAPVRSNGLRFDETLPLYGWLEDMDFSRSLAPFGRIVRAEALRGVHLGTKGGRNSGVRFGYSQVANPLYLAGKRRISPRRALVRIGRNLVANAVKLFRPEPWVDRRGRLFGNGLALLDLARGRLSPAKILQLR